MAKEIQLAKKYTGPDYEKIYLGIIEKRLPFKRSETDMLLNKKNKTAYDIIELDKLISGMVSEEEHSFNQKHRAYDEDTIKYILEYQSKYALSNIKTSEIFQVSRNTISKWKKSFR